MKETNVTSEPRKFRTKHNPICYMELNPKLNVDKLKSVKRGCALRVPLWVIADQILFWEGPYKIVSKNLEAQHSSEMQN